VAFSWNLLSGKLEQAQHHGLEWMVRRHKPLIHLAVHPCFQQAQLISPAGNQSAHSDILFVLCILRPLDAAQCMQPLKGSD